MIRSFIFFMSAEDKSTKKDSKIISEMRKILEKEPVFDKWYDELISEIEDSSKEYEESFSRYKQVMKDSDDILKLTKDKLDDGKKKKSTSFNEENVKVWIEEALVKKGIMVKNHDYFSRIRGQIRAITDSKEEYEALRDDILNSYQSRFDNNNPYTIRFNDNPLPSRFGGDVTDKVILTSDSDKITSSKKWSEGYHTNFDEKESCYDGIPSHLKSLEQTGLKYYWVLGKNGVIICKYNARSYDDLPRNAKNQINTQPRLIDALDKHNEKVIDFYVYDAVAQLHEISKTNNIKFNSEEYKQLEKQLWDKSKNVRCGELVDNLNSCLANEGLTNQNTGEPLFDVKFIKNGK